MAVPAHRIEGREEGSPSWGVPEPYLSAIARAGGEPVLVVSGAVAPEPRPDPTVDDAVGPDGATAAAGGQARAEAVLARMDALVLPGGRDLDPARYGQAPHSLSDAPDPVRDDLELDLALAAIRAGTPTLAICRGFQVLNVALGGTLHQHLPDVTRQEHVGDGEGDAFHPVRVDGGSRLAAVCGPFIECCASHHHQGVDVLSHQLRAVAWSDDGLVEAAEPVGEGPPRWLLAVQWHPERTAVRDPVQQRLFDTLVEAASGERGAFKYPER